MIILRDGRTYYDVEGKRMSDRLDGVPIPALWMCRTAKYASVGYDLIDVRWRLNELGRLRLYRLFERATLSKTWGWCLPDWCIGRVERLPKEKGQEVLLGMIAIIMNEKHHMPSEDAHFHQGPQQQEPTPWDRPIHIERGYRVASYRCPVCALSFSSWNSFNYHSDIARAIKRCPTPQEMERLNMTQDIRGRWHDSRKIRSLKMFLDLFYDTRVALLENGDTSGKIPC